MWKRNKVIHQMDGLVLTKCSIEPSCILEAYFGFQLRQPQPPPQTAIVRLSLGAYAF